MPCSWTGNLALWRWWSFFTHAFGHLMQRADSFEKTLMLGKIEGKRRGDDRGWDGWMASSTQRTWVWVDSGSWWWTGRPGVLWLMGSQRVGHDWVTELNWRWLPVDIVTDGYPFSKKKIHILENYWFTILCFRCTAKWFSYIYIQSFPDSFPTGYYRILSRVAYAILEVLFGYLFYILLVCVCSSQFLMYPSPPCFPFSNHKSVFRMWESVSVF